MNDKGSGNMFKHYLELDSTNLEAEKLLEGSRPAEGTVIMADFQRSGKGLGQNKWVSNPGENLLMSMILYPEFLPAQDQFMLNKAVSLAVVGCVEKYMHASEIKIKWPNDIYAGHGKIAGILIKNTISGLVIRNTIVGIGLNVNQIIFSAELPNPVSMALLTGKKFNRGEVLQTLTGQLNRNIDSLQHTGYEDIDRKYLDKLMNHNKPSLYKEDGGNIFRGTIRGVDEFGHLIMQTAAGIKVYDMKEITYIFEKTDHDEN